MAGKNIHQFFIFIRRPSKVINVHEVNRDISKSVLKAALISVLNNWKMACNVFEGSFVRKKLKIK